MKLSFLFFILFILYSQPVLAQNTSLTMDFDGNGKVDAKDLPLLIQQKSELDLQASDIFRLSKEWKTASNIRINLETGMQEVLLNIPNLPSDAIPLVMVKIPAGTFLMGSQLEPSDPFINVEWSQHQVTISQAFYIGKFEVTQAQWMAIMGDNPSQFTGNINRPVEQVSWIDAKNFMNEINKLGIGGFRFPTEAEWEYACRAGTNTAFSHGSGESCTIPSFPCEEHVPFMWYLGTTSGTFPRTVGTKLPNPWGLHDMHGNVFEWCSDFWQAPFNRGPVSDPQGPPSGNENVIRSGSFISPDFNCRSANRSSEETAGKLNNIGFRLVATGLN